MISRFAPSPTGHLHLGHAYSAVLGHARARESGGKFLLRIEDLDPTRSRPEFVNGIYEDLIWLGLEWDQPMLVQSQRSAVYAEALERVAGAGARLCLLLHPRGHRRSARGAAWARRRALPGTCRALPDDPERRAAMPHCWRLDSVKALEIAGFPEWTEDEGRRFSTGPDDFDDVILARKDAPAAYHLACVVDDAASGVTLVVRAADLRSSTPIQRLLQTLLGFPEPTYPHHPLVAHADGGRLAKRDRAPTLAAMRENGVDGPGLAVDLLDGKLPLGFAFVDA